ncbi:regulatory helix-turn-helix LysR family protein [Kushneria sinocarnis]|uniref:Regulatory helix-turn-helix LysR family protein n=1 Tax=Kushneria sinocarnis TaxID=595502 RepID=A0A420WUK4_9GAMM|nr:LysR family transcriptional regulator [Kushneria sinocarnis]RKQ97126.1 regulatory helix-turn-helix LysR family protein [Kushneria sinocarnis]
MNLTIRHYRCVVALADTRNYHRAAEMHGISHTNICAVIKRVSEMTGLVLFRRDGNRMEVTDEGAMFVAAARDIVESHDDMLAHYGIGKKQTVAA